MTLTKTPICDFGQKAEKFKLKSINNELISLEDIKGINGTLIMFICNHCPYVKAIIKDLVEDCNNLKKDGIFFIEVPNCEYEPMLQSSIQKNPHLFHFTQNALSKLVENVGYKILSCDVFRPATKSEGIRQKIMKNSFPYYPRIMTDVHSGRDLRIILKNS